MKPRWLCIVCLFVGIATSAVQAQQTKDPLRFVPSQAEWVLTVNRPIDVLTAIEKNEIFQQAQKLAGVRDFYDSTNFHRFYQLVAYFEKELGKSRHELLDELGSGGLVIAAKFTPPEGALLVMQAKEEKTLRQFVDLGLAILEKDLERQESKERIVRKKYLQYDVGQIGSKLHFAIADGALLLASDAAVVKLALDLQSKSDNGITRVTAFAEARGAAPAKALAWTWINLEQARKIPNFKNGLDAAALDPLATVVVGGFVDILRRSPYVTGTLMHEGHDYRLGFFTPRGREGMAPVAHMILPADGEATLPLLQPPHTISSSSYFLDLGQFWDKREEILGKTNAAGLTKGEKDAATFLGGIKIGQLLHAVGPHHRFVVAQQREIHYKKPVQLQAYALVVNMRNASFAKDMIALFRSGALLGTFKYGLQLKEETVQGCDMVSYFFSETKKVPDDPDGFRFNFSPTYVTVGDQFVMSSTVELARDLIATIKSEPKQQPGRAVMRTQIFATGIGDMVRTNQDRVLTQLLLSKALSPQSAKEELSAILNLVEQLGTLRVESNYGTNDFRYEILWQPLRKP